MKVLILTGFFWPAYKAGGPARSLTNLAAALARNHEVLVVTGDRDLGDEVPYPHLTSPTEVDGATVHYVDVRSPRSLLDALRMLSHRHFDVAILNSVWSVQLSFLPAIALWTRRLKSDLVVLMPRGELEAGALALKSGKKRLAAGLVRYLYGHVADVLAATSPTELANGKAWFPEMPGVLVSNIPDRLAPSYEVAGGEELRILYVGRIHPTKGLLELLVALRHVVDPVVLVIAGPVGDEAYAQRCRVESENVADQVRIDWRGPVDRDQLESLLWASDLMVTLTMGENFGHTIAESLQAGTPVLATDKTPWTEVLRAGGGYVVQDRSDSLAVARVIESARQDKVGQGAGVRVKARRGFDEWLDAQPFDVVEAALGASTRRESPAPGSEITDNR